eukprot:22134-Eustigmatos_ZCMA.PRE.1
MVARGYEHVYGVDEAGRGALAGPVIVAACAMPLDLDIPGIRDSKLLSLRRREQLYEILANHPRVSWAIDIVSSDR